MNHPEYVRALEYRERLIGLLNNARRTMTDQGFSAFSRGIEHEISQLDHELATYARGSQGRFAAWLGMGTRTYSVGNCPGPIPGLEQKLSGAIRVEVSSTPDSVREKADQLTCLCLA